MLSMVGHPALGEGEKCVREWRIHSRQGRVATQRVYLQGAPPAGRSDEPLLDPVEVLGYSRVHARISGFRTAAPERCDADDGEPLLLVQQH